MNSNKFIEQIKTSQNLHYEATLKIIGESKAKQTEDLNSLLKILCEDLTNFNKSIDETIKWYERERKSLLKEAIATLYEIEDKTRYSTSETFQVVVREEE